MSAEFHSLDVATAASSLGVDPAVGLSASEASERAAASGPNALEEAKREPVWRMVVEAVTEPFVLLLVVAGVLAIVVGEARDGLLVLVGLLPIVGADVVTEYRGERALEALREASAPMARVRRDGPVAAVPAATLVPGDVVLLQGGDVVPADVRHLRADRLLVDRSVLTGESIPEEARVEPDPRTRRSPAAARSPTPGRASSAGAARASSSPSAPTTEFGRIAGSLASQERRRSPAPARARPARADPARRRDRADRVHDRHRVRCAATRSARTSWPASPRRSPRSPRSRRSCSPSSSVSVPIACSSAASSSGGSTPRRRSARSTSSSPTRPGRSRRTGSMVSSVRTLAGPVDGPADRADACSRRRCAPRTTPGRGEGIAPGVVHPALRAAVAERAATTTLDRGDLVEADARRRRRAR